MLLFLFGACVAAVIAAVVAGTVAAVVKLVGTTNFSVTTDDSWPLTTLLLQVTATAT